MKYDILPRPSPGARFLQKCGSIAAASYRSLAFAFVTSAAVFTAPTQAQITGQQVISGDTGGWTVAWAQANDGRLYHGGDLFGLFRSDDRGQTWFQTFNGFQSNEDMETFGIAVVPTNSNKVYYYGGQRIMRSLDGGLTFPIYTTISRANLYPENQNEKRDRGSYSIALKPGTEDEVWVVGRRSASEKVTLIRSINGGETFSDVGGSIFNSDFRRAITINFRPNNANHVWIGTTDGAYVSLNGGSDWTLVPGTAGKAIRAVGLSPAAGVNTAIITWYLNVAAISATNWNDVSTYSISNYAFENNGGKQSVGRVVGLRSGKFLVTDDTRNMSRVNSNGTFDALLISSRNNPGGEATPDWADMTKEVQIADNWSRNDMIEDISIDNTLYCDGGAGPSKSTDGGQSWTFIPHGVRGIVTGRPVVFEGAPNRVYVPSNDKGTLVITNQGTADKIAQVSKKFLQYDKLYVTLQVSGTPNGQTAFSFGGMQGVRDPIIHKTTDGGSTWSLVPFSGLPVSSNKDLQGNMIAGGVIDKDNPNEVLVLMGSAFGTVHRSTNGGLNFGTARNVPQSTTSAEQNFKSSFIERCEINANRRYVLIRETNSLHISDDKGETWYARSRNGGWPDAFSVDPKRQDHLWIGTFYDLSFTNNAGQTWNIIDSFQGVASVDAVDGRVLVYARRNNASNWGLWYSPNAGTTWQQLDNANYRFPNPRNSQEGKPGWKFVLDRNDPNKFWCGGVSVVAYTFNGGSSSNTAPSITTNPSSVTVTAGSSASFSVAASGNPAPTFQWQRAANGSSTFNDLSIGGAYSGVNSSSLTVSSTTTTMSGDRFRAVATNSVNSAPSTAATLTVNAQPQPVITSALTRSATVGTAISNYTITATNSPTSYNATNLPAGLSVNTSTGVISGTPTTAGTVNTSISATNSGGGTGTATLVFTISAAAITPPSITSALTATATQNSSFSYTITASNSPSSYSASSLPAGLSVNTSTGVISGTPTGTGTSNVTLSATNGGGTGANSILVLTVNAASGGGTPVKLAGTIIGTTGSYNNNGSTRDKAFDSDINSFFDAASASGNWVGLDLGTAQVITQVRYYPRSDYPDRMNGGVFQGSNTADFSSGVTTLHTIGGNPPVSYTTVAITNSSSFRYVRYLSPNGGYGNVAEVEFFSGSGSTVTAPSITSALSATATQNSSFSYTITASNSPTSYSASGLPAGLSVNTSTGVISGTPTATGTSNISISATNGGGTGPSSTLVLTVNAPASGGTNTGTGLRARYYTNTGLAGTPALTRTDSTVNFEWPGSPGSGIGSDNFSVRWDGRIEAPVTGTYTLSTQSDDGVRVWVNGVLVINQWIDQGPTIVTGSPTLSFTAGTRYRVVMEYYEAGGGAVARLSWAYPGQATQIIPQGRLYAATSTIISASNLSFESNTGQTPTDWNTWANTPANEACDFVETANPRIGSNNLRHASSTGAYQVNTSRTITGLTNGTYLVRAWTRSSGGQATVGFNISNHGSPGQIYFEVKDATAFYVERTLSVPVTNGQMTIGFWSDATAANQWLIVDEISVERQP